MKSRRKHDDSQSMFVDVARSWPVRKGSHKKYVGYQIGLAGNRVIFSGNAEPAEPLLHVFCWSVDVDFDRFYMGYPVEAQPPFKLWDNRLIVWSDKEEGDEWEKFSWTFSLRLATLHSDSALRDQVVRPAIALLSIEMLTSELQKGTALTAAFPDTKSLVVYNDENDIKAPPPKLCDDNDLPQHLLNLLEAWNKNDRLTPAQRKQLEDTIEEYDNTACPTADGSCKGTTACAYVCAPPGWLSSRGYPSLTAAIRAVRRDNKLGKFPSPVGGDALDAPRRPGHYGG